MITQSYASTQIEIRGEYACIKQNIVPFEQFEMFHHSTCFIAIAISAITCPVTMAFIPSLLTPMNKKNSELCERWSDLYLVKVRVRLSGVVISPRQRYEMLES